MLLNGAKLHVSINTYNILHITTGMGSKFSMGTTNHALNTLQPAVSNQLQNTVQHKHITRIHYSPRSALNEFCYIGHSISLDIRLYHIYSTPHWTNEVSDENIKTGQNIVTLRYDCRAISSRLYQSNGHFYSGYVLSVRLISHVCTSSASSSKCSHNWFSHTSAPRCWYGRAYYQMTHIHTRTHQPPSSLLSGNHVDQMRSRTKQLSILYRCCCCSTGSILAPDSAADPSSTLTLNIS